MPGNPLDDLLNGLRAAAEPSRLRLLAICSHGEWTVSELVQVMAQSQPRISRHLKLLAEAGLLERFREGGWVFYRRAQSGDAARVARSLCRLLPEGDPMLALDRQRLAAIRATRRRQAERFFDERAAVWDSEADVAVEAGAVEAELLRIFGAERCDALVDVGTGTGRILQVLAGQIGSGLGIDLSHDMLRVARANLDRREARNCQVRHGDMYQLPLADGTVAGVTLHQVLHFADDPQAALAEAARVLAPSGRLVVVDLAQHDLEWLRSEKGHRRLGFGQAEVEGWLEELGLEPAPVVRLAGEGADVCIWLARKLARKDDRHDATTIEPRAERAA
jgi:ArsR family transcriptional regulator